MGAFSVTKKVVWKILMYLLFLEEMKRFLELFLPITEHIYDKLFKFLK